MKNLSQSLILSGDEVLALVHIVSFLSATDPGLRDPEMSDNYIRCNIYLGGLKLVDMNGFEVQQPQL